jgi:signal transduction histidine kinase
MIIEASTNAASLLGLPFDPSQSEGAPCVICDRPLTDICVSLLESEEKLVKVRDGVEENFTIERVNIPMSTGENRYISLVVLPHVEGIIVLINDVTLQSIQQQRLQQQHHELILLHEQIKSRNEELTRLNNQLSELSQRKSDMLAIATHDIRSPLGVIINYVEFLLEGVFDPLTPNQQETVEILDEEGRRILKLLESLLNLHRLETNTNSLLCMFPLDAHEVTRQVVRSYENQAQQASVQLTFEECRWVQDEGKRIILMGDSDILQQAIGNLISNGLKYTADHGNVHVRLSYHPTPPILAPPLDHTKEWCSIEVRDNGQGIEKDDIEHIFNPFFRTRQARMKREGIGLGLSIVQRSIEQHNGRVTVESTYGQGTTFTIYLACKIEDEESLFEDIPIPPDGIIY